MNVFVLCTGRCGSVTFATACSHIRNYTVGHETRAKLIDGRFDYGPDHIEVDNRLSWFLGSLNSRFPDAFYVHLTRDPEATARSYTKRFGHRAGIMRGFVGIARQSGLFDELELARMYVRTVNDNISGFLADKPHVGIRIEDPHAGFDEMWGRVSAGGDRAAAHAVLDEQLHRS